MSTQRKVALVTGASQGIGAGVVQGFIERGYNVVATSRSMTRSTEVAASDRIALVDGDKLIELFESLELGLKPRTTYDLDLAFFEEYRKAALSEKSKS